ncbi:MAG: hypothetical protein KDK48_01645 [Chlamydiia bacterium]|nr:hypothetical protein [Chlamydiia bacterium]
MNLESIRRQGGVPVLPTTVGGSFGDDLKIEAGSHLSKAEAEAHDGIHDRVVRRIDPKELLKTSEVALNTLGMIIEPLRIAYSVVSFILDLIGVNSLKSLGRLIVPTGFKGSVCALSGQFLGYFYMIGNAGTISANIMTAVMNTGCRLYGESYIASTIARYGGLWIAEKTLTPVVIFVGGVTGGYALVILGNMAGNVVYKLCFSDPEQKAVADQLKEAAEKGAPIECRSVVVPDKPE